MLTLDRLRRAYDSAAQVLLDEATPDGNWVGELSSSPLSTATAIAALELVRRQRPDAVPDYERLVGSGLTWLVEHQNPDGGWGDTVLSHSNISTTTLVYASFCLVGASSSAVSAAAVVSQNKQTVTRAKEFVDRQGGFDAIRRRYGKDHTFSVPILTQCALAGLIPWSDISPLPFELGWLPHWFYRWVRLPVVSYALPALIAIGQVRHHMAPSRNPLLRGLRNLAIAPTLRRLTDIQPESGGFLEATPLTSFVTMSLAAKGLADHPVARKGIEFLRDSMRSDGSWPIDTNLATWVTTLSVNALRADSLPPSQKEFIASWLYGQQHREVHRYTNADPGGWAWTNLSGGVPDADDTPGAVLAVLKLNPSHPELPRGVGAAVEWLLNLQNSDGGWPTFCRGWGALPFDRSTPDLTSHALRALLAWVKWNEANASVASSPFAGQARRIERSVRAGFSFLARTQRADGTWFPLWFGNQHSADEENPVYGVSRSLMAYRDWGRLDDPTARKALDWLASVQNSDGGWGGASKTPSSTEETAVAVEALLPSAQHHAHCLRGLVWLEEKIETKKFRNPAPIGLYFAKLWYFERLYPIIFTVSTLARATELASNPSAGPWLSAAKDFQTTTTTECASPH